ncbi:MAG: gamma-glutamylcyclotransferase family protein [Acidimicrobiales bacterium]
MTPRCAFVYGTLMPGRARWPWLAPYVLSHYPDSARGRLYDTGFGYPAACFDEAGRVPGVCCTLDPAMLDEAWAMLDDIEGTLYARVDLVTASGRAATAYGWIGDRAGLTELRGRWVDP